MSFEWLPGQSPTQVWTPNIQRFVKMLENGIILIFEGYAPQIEADMKVNATWTDQTGNARQTLAVLVYIVEEGVVALLAKQQMDYGLYLELKNGGRFAIVLPTLEQYYGQVWGDVKDMMDG